MNNDKIIYIESTDSTNEYAKEYCKTNHIYDETIFFTNNQLKGKGTNNNIWISEPFKNLTLSIVLHPIDLEIENFFYLNMSISLAIKDFIQNLTTEKVKIKWPNDIFIKNKKISGILIENILQGNHFVQSICGVGININQTNIEEIIPYSCSLKNITGTDYSIENLIIILQKEINIYYSLLKEKKYNQIKKEFINCLLNFNTYKNYKTLNNTMLNAKIIDVSSFGDLIMIDNNNNKQQFGFKEISFINE